MSRVYFGNTGGALEKLEKNYKWEAREMMGEIAEIKE